MSLGEAYEEVCRLLPRVPRAPEQPFPGGASDEELADLARRLDLELPIELADWLRVCKGEQIGPGGVFGARPDDEDGDIVAQLSRYPRWRVNGWLPIAGDGCGNCYVLLTSDMLAGFVGFVDVQSDPDFLDCVVASDLWRFLAFLFTRELGESRWPHDPDEVLAKDPELARATAELLPWNGDD
jgi:hypothetical protein